MGKKGSKKERIVVEGEEITVDDPRWPAQWLEIGDVLEWPLSASSLPIFVEGVVAVLLAEVSVADEHGTILRGRVLGVSEKDHLEEVRSFEEGGAMTIHLCSGQPCSLKEDGTVVHLVVGKWWTVQSFVKADYLDAEGVRLVKEANARAGKAADRGKGGKVEKPAGTPKASARRGALRRKAEEPGGDGAKADRTDQAERERRERFRARLSETRERVLGGGEREPVRKRAPLEDNGELPSELRLVAGTSLNPPLRAWYYERLEEEDAGCFWAVAGCSRATRKTGQGREEGEEVEEKEWREEIPRDDGRHYGQEEEEREREEGKETEEERQRLWGSSTRTRGRRRQSQRVRNRVRRDGGFKQRSRRRRELRRLRLGNGSPLEEKVAEEAGVSDGPVDPTRTGAAGQGGFVRRRRRLSRRHLGDRDLNVLWLDDPTISCHNSPDDAGSVSSGTMYRPPSKRPPRRGSRWISCPIRGGAYRTARRWLANRFPSRNIPTDPDKCSLHINHAGSQEAPEVDHEKPRVDARQAVAKWRGPELVKRIWRGWRRKRQRKGKEQGQGKERKRQRRMEQLESELVPGVEQSESEPESVGEEPRRQRQRCKEEGGGRQREVSGDEYGIKEDGLERQLKLGRLQVFATLSGHCKSLREFGCSLAWLIFQGEALAMDGCLNRALEVMGCSDVLNFAMHRDRGKRSRSLFPFRCGPLKKVKEAVTTSPLLVKVVEADFVEKHAVECWMLVAVTVLNGLAGCGRAIPDGRWGKPQNLACETVERRVKAALTDDVRVGRTILEVEKELSERFLTYSGEEVPKMEILTVEQVEPALPPQGHGGCIDAISWVCNRTKCFLNNPEACVLPDDGRDLPRLQAKIHIAAGEELDLARLLVERGICTWTHEDDVFTYRNQKVLNGLFGVRKSAVTKSGAPCLRLIMNLIPSNSCLHQLRGTVTNLPNICQWLSLTINEQETLQFAQSDMSSAFYLFRIPSTWSRYISFNLSAVSSEIGGSRDGKYYLSCSVVPMGWASAVGVMQEMADNLAKAAGLLDSSKVVRQQPLPGFMTQLFEKFQRFRKKLVSRIS